MKRSHPVAAIGGRLRVASRGRRCATGRRRLGWLREQAGDRALLRARTTAAWCVSSPADRVRRRRRALPRHRRQRGHDPGARRPPADRDARQRATASSCPSRTCGPSRSRAASDARSRRGFARAMQTPASRRRSPPIRSRRSSTRSLRITVDVVRFDAVPNGEAVVEALWSIRRPADDASRTGRTVASAPIAGVELRGDRRRLERRAGGRRPRHRRDVASDGVDEPAPPNADRRMNEAASRAASLDIAVTDGRPCRRARPCDASLAGRHVVLVVAGSAPCCRLRFEVPLRRAAVRHRLRRRTWPLPGCAAHDIAAARYRCRTWHRRMLCRPTCRCPSAVPDMAPPDVAARHAAAGALPLPRRDACRPGSSWSAKSSWSTARSGPDRSWSGRAACRCCSTRPACSPSGRRRTSERRRAARSRTSLRLASWWSPVRGESGDSPSGSPYSSHSHGRANR